MRTLAFAALFATAGAFSAYAQETPVPEAPPVEAETTAAEDSAAIPAAEQTVAELAAADARFSTLAAALTAAGLDETLQGSGPFTVFAPTNDAFAAEGEDTIAAWMAPENKQALTDTLSYHVVAGTIRAEDLAEGTTEVPTLQGGNLTVIKTADGITVNGAQVSAADIMASNGVIHGIDAVAKPSGTATQ